MGATAIGIGINTGWLCGESKVLAELTNIQVTLSPDLIEATVDTGIYSNSGTLKRCAVKLSKICNDLRLLSQVLVPD
jgi:aspartate ammonia-lyase